MNKLNILSFEKMVKSVLNNSNSKEKNTKKPIKYQQNNHKIQEAMGPGVYTPAGLNTITQDPIRGQRGENPPFSLYSDIVSKGAQDPYMGQSDKDIEAPKRKPYPLEFAAEEIAVVYTTLQSTNFKIKEANINPSLRPEQKELLNSVNQKIKTILGNLKSISQDLQKINL